MIDFLTRRRRDAELFYFSRKGVKDAKGSGRDALPCVRFFFTTRSA